MSSRIDSIKEAIVDGDDETAVSQTEAALEEQIEAADIVKKAVVPGIERAGQLWKENVYFMPDVVLSAEAFKAAMEIVSSRLPEAADDRLGRFVMGVVAGDMHDLGKDIVTAMLTGAGFQVIDLGVDVPRQTFIEKTRELRPDILGIGCYMTTTMREGGEIIRSLKDEGLREGLHVMVGGVPTTQDFADEIGADAWGKDALDAVEKAKQIMER